MRLLFRSLVLTGICLSLFPVILEAQYLTGPRGGCYTLSASGRKRYVDRSLCATEAPRAAAAAKAPSEPAVAAAEERYIRGPRGGCYTVSASGRKNYVDRSLCAAAVSGRAAAPVPSAGYIRGPRGGCYTVSASGRKNYVDHSLCETPAAQPAAAAVNLDQSGASTTGDTYIRGPRGGCYTVGSGGRKRYVDRSMCN